MVDEDENDVKDTSGYEKSRVRLASLGWEDFVSVKLQAESGHDESPHLSPSRPQHYNHLGTRSQVIPLYFSMPCSRVNIEYSIHRVQHTLSPAYTAYCCIIPRLTVSRSQPVSQLSEDHVVLNSPHAHDYKVTNQ
jgi:hypothetical protein